MSSTMVWTNLTIKTDYSCHQNMCYNKNKDNKKKINKSVVLTSAQPLGGVNIFHFMQIYCTH